MPHKPAPAAKTSRASANASTRKLSVPVEAQGARLDKWLAESVSDVSRSRLKVLIEDGAVTVAGKIETDPAHRLRSGVDVRLLLPPTVDATPAAQEMDLDIVFEDEHLIVINKPAGLVVHPAPGNPDQTLVNALLAHCGGTLAGIGGVKRPGIVHRIDKDTSGLLVIAKTDAAYTGLAAQFSAHTIERSYDAVVWGVPRYESNQITGNIGRSHHNRKKMAILKGSGKPAETGYQVLEVFGEVATLVRCRLKTGRTHQIRVHMASVGNPLIGDVTYGSNRRRSMRGVPHDVAAVLKAFPRQALHARTLGFVHPVTGKKVRFERPPPEDFQELVEALAAVDAPDVDEDE